MLRWMDGFDHYGSNVALMRNGAYAEVTSCTLTSTPSRVRTGTRALLMSSIGNGSVRRTFGAQLQAVGVGVAFDMLQLPDSDIEFMRFQDSAGNRNVYLLINSAGEIVARVGVVSTVEIARSAPVVGAGSYQHWEAKVVIDNVAGAVEVRLNGVTVLNVAGVDTQSTSEASASTVTLRAGGLAGGVAIDDFYCWDESGALNNDFIGDKKVYTRFPDADTTQEDWTPSVGVDSYAMLDNNPPVDGADYLSSTLPGERTDVELASLPAEIVSIAGVMIASRMWKTDAGNSKVQIGMVSGGAEAAGDPHALSMAASYYGDIFETDPDTAAMWTLAGLNLAQASIERTE